MGITEDVMNKMVFMKIYMELHTSKNTNDESSNDCSYNVICISKNNESVTLVDRMVQQTRPRMMKVII